jgi:DNA polymerase I-like protein with 3'-5' exonuclease and polymerase domains
VAETAEVRLADLLEKVERGEIRERVHPRFGIHSQANHRWSTTKPPLGQLPDHLSALFQPDEDWPWFGWDWDGQELAIIAAEAGDQPILEAREKGHDIHTNTTCEVFGYPYPPERARPHDAVVAEGWRKALAWQGKKDGRRTFAKQFLFSLFYGKKPKNAIHIPGAKQLGFTASGLEQSAGRLRRAHPAIFDWQRRTKERVLKTRVVRDFGGGRRVLFGQPDQIVRAAYDYPMQAGGVRMLNATLISLDERWGQSVVYKYGQHDSAIVGVHASLFCRDTLEEIADLVEREWVINGVGIRVKATFFTWTREGGKQAWLR